MCYATPAQTKSLPTKLFNATLIQPGFVKLSENDFRGLHLYKLESLRIYHFTLHSHKLTFTILAQFDFRVLHLHNMKSLSMIQFCILHSHNLTFPTFDQLFRSCCVCMFRYIYTYFIYYINIYLTSYLYLRLYQVVTKQRNELKPIWEFISAENLSSVFSELFICVHMNWGEMKVKTVWIS